MEILQFLWATWESPAKYLLWHKESLYITLWFLFLPGNKSDLSDLREVQLEEAQSLAEHYDNIICAIETSAKDSSNVEEAFVKMATELMMRHGGPMFSEKNTDSIKLDSKDVVEGWVCGCWYELGDTPNFTGI